MQVIKSVDAWNALKKTIIPTQAIGFVPTMGCLHNGHASLIRRAIAENDITVLSIFVNPAQFNETTDFENYPVTLESDLQMAEQLEVDYVFTPTIDDMYATSHKTLVHTDAEISRILEGKYRPGHFDGVLTIVLKLLCLIKPTRAYFGEKDYQQYVLIQQLVNDFFLNCEIVPCSIIRETSGLAMSSRNRRLSHAGVEKAEKFAQLFQQYGILSAEDIKNQLNLLGIILEYLSEYNGRVYIAARVDEVRLIDNRLIVK